MKLFKPLIIPLILVFGYLIFISYPYFFSKINRFDQLGIFNLIEEKSDNIKKIGKNQEALLKGEKIIGVVKSSENNLGILLVRFAQLSAIVKDRVIFRIKEEGTQNWYYENSYYANQFLSGEYFPFGFPVIPDSADKTYVFEVESLAGTGKNGIGLSPVKPQVALVYHFSKENLLSINLPQFIQKKLVYVSNNVNVWKDRVILIASFFIYFLILFIRNERIAYTKKTRRKLASIAEFLPFLKSKYLLRLKITVRFLKKLTRQFTAIRFYTLLLNTDMKKRLAIGLVILLIAFLYRFSLTSPASLGVSSFYAGLGGQGDYDQFIRTATCAVRSFCPAILGQNFLIEASILGTFYELFGFTGGLKVYLYLMIILSSIVAVLPYIFLSRKHFFTIGGIIGSLFLATSDYLTYAAINLPPDNGSLFAFSMFFIVYLLTMQYGTIRWLLFFGLMGTIDGLNKLMLLMNDLAVLILFAPIFFYEKAKRTKKFPFLKFDQKLIFYSILPLLVFLVLYSGWEYIVQIKFSTPYYLRALIEGGSTFASSTNEASTSISESLEKGNVLGIIYYYAGSTIVMLKRLIENAGLNAVFLTPIFIGLLFATLRKSTPIKSGSKFFITKLISIAIFTILAFTIILLFKNNYLSIQEVGQYVYAWSDDIYVNIFLFASIIFLFILNFKYQAFKLALPIIPYTIMLIILTKNAPWVRLLVHVIVWSIILLSFLIDWILTGWEKNDRKNILKRLWVGPIILVLFVFFYIIPKQVDMVGKLYSGIISGRIEVEYLKWVNSELPKNAIVLAGGKSDLITVAQNLNRPIIYNSVYSQALLIKPKEVPGVKPTDFAILSQLRISEIPRVGATDFNIIRELKDKGNFAKNKYLILEDDIDLWRTRLAGIADNVFATTSATQLHPNDYSIKVYKFNSTLNKSIYELNLKETENF